MTRVVAGSARGRRLVVPAGSSTRPTSDRAREGLFSTLEALLGTLAGRTVLDLYAGSGAVGLEALSRGAAAAVFVESDRRALAAIRSNVDALGLRGAEVVAADVARHLAERPAAVPPAPFDVAFLDPPYAVPDTLVADDVGVLVGRALLRPGGVLVVERSTRDGSWRWPPSAVADRERAYGEGTLWYGRAAASQRQPAPSPQE